MHKIVITEEDHINLNNHKFAKKLYEDFIFDSFELIRKHHDGFHARKFTVQKDNDAWDISFRDAESKITCNCELKAFETESGEIIGVVKLLDMVSLDPSAQLSFVQDLDKQFFGKELGAFVVTDPLPKTGFIPSKEVQDAANKSDIAKRFVEFIIANCRYAYGAMAYILDESYKRKSVELAKKGNVSLEQFDQSRKHRKMVKQDKYLLGTIINYFATQISVKHFIKCECWDVRGHFRHYKNGKVVFIKSYEKGKKSNTGALKEENTYFNSKTITTIKGE